MTAWLFDLGNTRLKCAPVTADGTVGTPIALSHRQEDVAAAMALHLPARIDVAYVASVARPELRIAVLDALAARAGRIAIARTQPRFGDVRIAYADPRKLGVDRFLAIVAAHRRASGAALVCGVGTALTIDLLDGTGLHRGGRIAPSPALMREALHARASVLPESGGRYAEFADDTGHALASGCEGAAIALVERSLREAERLLGAPPALWLHGGGAEALRDRLPPHRWTPDAVLRGLARWQAHARRCPTWCPAAARGSRPCDRP